MKRSGSHPDRENHIKEIDTPLSPSTMNDEAPDGAPPQA